MVRNPVGAESGLADSRVVLADRPAERRCPVGETPGADRGELAEAGRDKALSTSKSIPVIRNDSSLGGRSACWS